MHDNGENRSWEIDCCEAYDPSRCRNTAVDALNRPVPFAHVAVQIAESGRQITLFVTDKNGLARVSLASGNDSVTASADTWFVAMVRSSTANRTLFPLAWEWVDCKDGICMPRTARPTAFTNAILIDAVGSGAYEPPPLRQ